MAMPAARIEGKVRCALCNQVAFFTNGEEPWAEVQSRIRAHQRSEVCSGPFTQ